MNCRGEVVPLEATTGGGGINSVGTCNVADITYDANFSLAL